MFDHVAGALNGPAPKDPLGCRCFDCGFPISEDGASWPTCLPLARELLKTPETTQPGGSRNKQAFTLNGGTGTHIDAPSHFVPGGRTVDHYVYSNSELERILAYIFF